ncbi:MAG TPA: triose-phosphate isomerase [Frankiaceae bacterium]|nr:triose-phosphate isomerase [Frankiaceae bacterium]
MASRSGRRPLIAGNWKMNMHHLEAIALVQRLSFDLRQKETDAVEVLVIPPFTDLRSVQTLVDGDRLPIGYGAQDVSPHVSGAYTGDISGPMLAKLGCSYVVVGHSERRAYHGEDDALVARKAKAAVAHGITPIVCIGEPEEVRDAGGHIDHCLGSLDASLEGVEVADPAGNPGLVIAYEPVWAIGTGRSAGPGDAQEMCAAVRERVEQRFGSAFAEGLRVLYGGSVKPANTRDLLAGADVDGALVGGASIVADDFAAIVRAAVPG